MVLLLHVYVERIVFVNVSLFHQHLTSLHAHNHMPTNSFFAICPAIREEHTLGSKGESPSRSINTYLDLCAEIKL